MSIKDDTSEAGSSPRPDAEKVLNSKKRKSALEEIAVDISLPEPPSKKARRALKKGKTVTASKPRGPDDDADLVGEEPAAAAVDKPKVRSEHSIWVGNLPFTVTPTELREWLISHSGGMILEESITRIKMPGNKDKGPKAERAPRDAKPANKGFAYVDFDGAGPQMAAIALTETRLASRNLLIKDAKSFDGRPKAEKKTAANADGEDDGGDPAAAALKAKQEKLANRKVFVGNLSFDANEDELWSHFQKCGEIEWVKVATFEDTGKCKGYGWVRFRTGEGAAWAAKGFVKIKEAIETEEDFLVEGDALDGSAPKADGAVREKKFKMRKWWVNKLKGRTLKIEMAEDDQTRYKKRFKKDPKDGKGRAKEDGSSEGPGFIQDAVKSAMAAEDAAA